MLFEPGAESASLGVHAGKMIQTSNSGYQLQCSFIQIQLYISIGWDEWHCEKHSTAVKFGGIH